jgi:hypothetical protein
MKSKYQTQGVCVLLLGLACCSAMAQSASEPQTAITDSSGVAPTPAASAASAPADKPSEVEAYMGRAGDAVIAPLGDLNLVRAKIPAALREAAVAPYGEPAPHDCGNLAERIRALDAALGADLDAPKSGNEASLLERGVDQVGKASINMISDTTTGIVPFRGWVRRLTGAERHSKRVAAAITAGSLRRAYLKGYARAQGCPATVSSTPAAATASAAASSAVPAAAAASAP